MSIPIENMSVAMPSQEIATTGSTNQVNYEGKKYSKVYSLLGCVSQISALALVALLLVSDPGYHGGIILE